MTAVRGLTGLTGLAGIGAVSAGVWLQFGMPYGLITGGGLLIADALT